MDWYDQPVCCNQLTRKNGEQSSVLNNRNCQVNMQVEFNSNKYYTITQYDVSDYDLKHFKEEDNNADL